MNGNCKSCKERLRLWAIFVSLIMSLVKGIVGVLGSSESLVGDGLYSLYQSFLLLNRIFLVNVNEEAGASHKSFWCAGLVISIILILGIGDILIFSILRLIKATKGLLIRPSPYALELAILSILANQLLYRYSLCSGKETEEKKVLETEMVHSLRLSVILSSIAVIGIATARTISIYGDAIAAFIIAIIVIPRVIGLFSQSWKITTDWTWHGFQKETGSNPS